MRTLINPKNIKEANATAGVRRGAEPTGAATTEKYDNLTISISDPAPVNVQHANKA